MLSVYCISLFIVSWVIVLGHLVYSKPTTVDWQYTEDGEKVRVSKRTGRIVPLPPAYHEYPDGTIPEYYVGKW